MDYGQILNDLYDIMMNPDLKLQKQLEIAANMNMSYQERQFFSASKIVITTKQAMMTAHGLTKEKENSISLKQEMILPVLEYLNHYGCKLRKKDKTEEEATIDDFYDLYSTHTQKEYEEYIVVLQ